MAAKRITYGARQKAAWETLLSGGCVESFAYGVMDSERSYQANHSFHTFRYRIENAGYRVYRRPRYIGGHLWPHYFLGDQGDYSNLCKACQSYLPEVIMARLRGEQR